jgi:3-oxoacyl-[acyl-carrier protein] reductase
VQLDVRDSTACQQAIDDLLERTDRIDILVNNSGIVRDNLLVAFEDADIADVLDTNVGGVFNMARAAVPAMMRQRSGHIINVSSVSGERGGRGQANYAASKGAVNALTRALAVELARRKIRVNAVAPGIIETEMSQQVRDLAGDEALDRILLRRYGTAEEVAWLVTFLASRHSSYINGQVLHVDGGFKMA